MCMFFQSRRKQVWLVKLCTLLCWKQDTSFRKTRGREQLPMGEIKKAFKVEMISEDDQQFDNRKGHSR